MSVLAGCYERFLFGYNVQAADATDEAADEQALGLRRAFTHAAHKGVVKCVAAAGRYAATGGADDLIHLYDLQSDKDLSFLMSPGEGAVTAATFFTPAAAYNPTHLLTGSADGSISVWQVGGGWECMKTMVGHRKEVSSISVHPSGLLALSVSRDCCLRMWDLVKGRFTYIAKLEQEAEGVAFSREDGGSRYALLAGGRVTLHAVQGDAGLLRTLSHPRRVLCMAWAPGNRLVTGSEDGSLRLWDAQAGAELLCISRAHASRVRALALLPPAAAAGRLLVATGSSDGSLKLWDLSQAAAAGVPGASGGACLAEAQTRARLTCLAAADTRDAMRQGAAAAAVAGRQAAAQQQQQQRDKRRADTGGKQQPQRQQGAAGPPKKKLKQQQQAAGGEQQQGGARPGGAGGAPKPKAGGAAKAAQAGEAAPQAGVVVRDGVVEFLDSPDQQRRRQAKQKAVAQRSKQAAERGARFRSLPGEQRPPGARGKARRPKGKGAPRK